MPCVRLLCVLTLVASLLGADPGSAAAQPPQPTPGDTLMHRYLSTQADAIQKKILDGATTKEGWEERRPRLKQEYLSMLGLWPLPEKTPLKATITGSLERGEVAIDNLHFQSKPGLYVTANLYRPKGNTKKLPTILYLCGHSGRGRDGNKSAFQDHGLWFASNGYNCLILDTLQLGEIPGIHHGTYREGRWWWQALGYTPAGVECWNGVRAIDYLVSRKDVDADRLGITGISGGGAATGWIAAADERIKVVVPVSGWTDLDCLIKQKIINGHCDCMFHVNTYQWEFGTILGLIAPRPMLFANSDNDRIFPMDGNRRLFETLRKLYKMHGKEQLVQEYVSKGGHDYRPDLRLAIFEFFDRHLLGVRRDIKDADFPKIPGPELRVFPTDADLPKDVLNGKIDETFVPRAKVELPDQRRFTAWKSGLMKQLKEEVLRSGLEQVPAARGKDELIRGMIDGTSWTDTPLEVNAGLLQVEKGLMQKATLVVLNPGETWQEVEKWFSLERETHAYTLSPRGVGRTAWIRKSPPNYVERSHALLGMTVDEGRVRDVVAFVRKVTRDWGTNEGVKSFSIKLVGKGQAGILCAYAALFESRVKEVVVIDPPKSHMDGPIFLNVLRVLDIPDALGMLAPHTRLTLINAKDAAFDRTVEIYRRAGAEDKITRK